MADQEMVEFLRAQWTAEEAQAQQTHELECSAVSRREDIPNDPRDCDCGVPAKTLARIAAYRRILEEWENAEPGFRNWSEGYGDGLGRALILLAQEHAGKPGFRPHWKV